MKRFLIRSLIVVGVLLLLGWGSLQSLRWYFGHLYQNLVDQLYTSDFKPRKNIDNEAARKALHRILGWPFHGEHDAFLYAADLGDYATVPLLIRDLKFQYWTKPGDGMDCEKAHCIDSLVHITGVNAGSNYEDWAKWWEEKGKCNPHESVAPTIRLLRMIQRADRAYQGSGRSPKRPPLPIEGLIEALCSAKGEDGKPLLSDTDPSKLMKDQWGTPIRLLRDADGKLSAISAGLDRKFATEDDLPPRRFYGQKPENEIKPSSPANTPPAAGAPPQ